MPWLFPRYPRHSKTLLKHKPQRECSHHDTKRRAYLPCNSSCLSSGNHQQRKRACSHNHNSVYGTKYLSHQQKRQRFITHILKYIDMVLVTITKESGIPLIGHLAFGIVCRGNSNLVQVRPTTICNINCPFCSTDGGPFSTTHKTNYTIELNYLVSAIKELTSIKGPLHINIDSVGEPTTYLHLTKFIALLHETPGIQWISMQTNGTLLNKEKIQELEKAGLNRINLSIHAMSDDLAKKLAGANIYNIEHIRQVARDIQASTIELLLAPVYLPGINDAEIKQIIAFAKELGCKIAIQKYEEYKYSRKMKETKKQNFYKFYQQLKQWEREFNIRLVYNAKSLDVGRAPAIPQPIKENERANVKILAEGWMKNQKIAAYKNRCVTITNCSSQVNDKVNIRITDTKNNIILAELI